MTKEEINKSTKEVIIEVASDLFARNGFAGTSVREIAKQASVNLAAINYHFKNKDNLYWKVFEHNHSVINDSILKIGEGAKNTEELTIKVFDLFVSRDTEIMNTFKMFLSDNVEFPEEDFKMDENEMGPPGKEIFAQTIIKDVKVDLPLESVKWGVKTIFSLVVHFGVIMGTSFIKTKSQFDDEFSVDNIKKVLRHSVRAHLSYLESNPKLK